MLKRWVGKIFGFDDEIQELRCQIRELNEELGYTEVDRRIKETFSVSFRRSDVVAR